MNLNNLNDTALLSNTKSLVASERELLTQILHHLREVDRRKLFSALKYKSLFEYAVIELGYSEDQAYRRINAMKLLKELPELEEKLNTGALTLTNISVATQVFHKETKINGKSRSSNEKLKMLQAIENKSKREAEVIVQTMTNLPKEAFRPELIKPQGEEHIEVRFTARRSLEGKIKRIKGLLAHSHPNLSTAELFEKLCDEFIAKREKSLGQKASRGAIAARGDAPACGEVADRGVAAACGEVADRKAAASGDEATDSDTGGRTAKKSDHQDDSHQTQRNQEVTKRRRLPAHIKRFIWHRDRNQCVNCGSQFALEIDHIKPLALNGPTTASNLRLLCRSCNQRKAIEHFGVNKIEKHTERL